MHEIWNWVLNKLKSTIFYYSGVVKTFWYFTSTDLNGAKFSLIFHVPVSKKHANIRYKGPVFCQLSSTFSSRKHERCVFATITFLCKFQTLTNKNEKAFSSFIFQKKALHLEFHRWISINVNTCSLYGITSKILLNWNT